MMKLPAGGSTANRATRLPTGDWETGRAQLASTAPAWIRQSSSIEKRTTGSKHY
jgi:hypothetical protein